MASEEIAWVPPETIEELFAKTGANKWSSINKPTAGPQTEADLPDTPLALQLYSLATPNGQKVSILLEELGVEYDAHVINVGKGDQFTTGFVSVNPNSKIPALLDKEGPDGKPIRVFESVSIDLYLVEKFKSSLFPADFRLRTEVLNWLFFQTSGQGPMTGNFGHFFAYAPPDKLEARDYGVGRYGMETQRICSVMERHLEGRTYFVGEEYSLADIVLFPWFQGLRTSSKHAASGRTAFEFLKVEQYKNLIAWADRILARPAVFRGLQVCSLSGKAKPWLEEKETSSAI